MKKQQVHGQSTVMMPRINFEKGILQGSIELELLAIQDEKQRLFSELVTKGLPHCRGCSNPPPNHEVYVFFGCVYILGQLTSASQDLCTVGTSQQVSGALLPQIEDVLM